MKINEYYQETANIWLNGSIAALFPAVFIIGGNLSFIQNKEIMLLTIPFFVYSFFSFQIYLFKKRQSISIGRNIVKSKRGYHSIFDASHLLIMYLNIQASRLMLFFPDGFQAGFIKRCRKKELGIFSKVYALYNSDNRIISYYRIKKKRHLKIEVFSINMEYLGCYEKKRIDWLRYKKELLNASGRFIGSVEGSKMFMDEQVIDKSKLQIGRLRRGWMPLEWSSRFPEANTPVLTFAGGISKKDKLLRISFLIHEFFIER
ncbi:hypothetical protein [Neobacillus massiliamazoniensis]|uniref:Uncharacterized protein n=1 Tax=Neobacillus massiliamazoniensis TaxID=1499688 RepID=A0A0U1P113_9BACI|nr:hypothetical protein [Neobacillus massiliamazoniensis]CRK83772.1 hypothetical protein BN000_03766 [Neobacillus massiliamazoniensis]